MAVHKNLPPNEWHGAKTTTGLYADRGTPSVLGELYYATDTEQVLIATGTSSNSDWVQINSSSSGANISVLKLTANSGGASPTDGSNDNISWSEAEYDDFSSGITFPITTFSVPETARYRITLSVGATIDDPSGNDTYYQLLARLYWSGGGFNNRTLLYAAENGLTNFGNSVVQIYATGVRDLTVGDTLRVNLDWETFSGGTTLNTDSGTSIDQTFIILEKIG
jgi:hypothetical protein